MTVNQLEYMKELRRIQQTVRRAEKRGYRFNENVVPQTPKRVTKKALQTIKEITPVKIYSKAQYLDEHTGKVVSGQEGRKLEAQARGRKASATRQRNLKIPKPKLNNQGADKTTTKGDQYYPNGGSIIYSNVLEQFIQRLSEPPQDFYVTRSGKKGSKDLSIVEASERAKHTLLSITQGAIEREGKEAVGWRLEENADTVNTLVTYILYGSNSSSIASACSELASIINGGALSLEQLKDIAEQEEYNEDTEMPS